jgi:hypothetical protein
VQHIQRYVARMNRLIGDLLDIVSIEFPDQKTRCVPTSDTYSLEFGHGWHEMFADSQCTMSLGYSYRSLCGEPGFAYWSPTIGDGPELSRMMAMGPPDVATIYSGFRIPGDVVVGCEADPELPALLYTATPVGLDELVLMTEVIE